jgi:hypothetical protein
MPGYGDRYGDGGAREGGSRFGGGGMGMGMRTMGSGSDGAVLKKANDFTNYLASAAKGGDDGKHKSAAGSGSGSGTSSGSAPAAGSIAAAAGVLERHELVAALGSRLRKVVEAFLDDTSRDAGKTACKALGALGIGQDFQVDAAQWCCRYATTLETAGQRRQVGSLLNVMRAHKPAPIATTENVLAGLERAVAEAAEKDQGVGAESEALRTVLGEMQNGKNAPKLTVPASLQQFLDNAPAKPSAAEDEEEAGMDEAAAQFASASITGWADQVTGTAVAPAAAAAVAAAPASTAASATDLDEVADALVRSGALGEELLEKAKTTFAPYDARDIGLHLMYAVLEVRTTFIYLFCFLLL